MVFDPTGNSLMKFLKTHPKICLFIKAYRTLSAERMLVVWFLFVSSFVFLLAALISFNNRFIVVIPKSGGTLHEGILGTPRYINPALALNEQDKDVASLIFTGLTRFDKDGNPVNDLASKIEESQDGLTYTVHLRNDAFFHDGTKLTANDILFTISKVQDPLIKSPLKIEWEGVKVEKDGDYKLIFTLKQPYASFLSTLTLGIMPEHLWKNLSPEEFPLTDLNIYAVGSGPFKLEKVETSSGVPKVLKLVPHKHYTRGKPFLGSFELHFFANEKLLLAALKNKTITRVHGIGPDTLNTLNLPPSQVATLTPPRTFGIFLNPNEANFLANKDIRTALNLAINRKELVENVYYGYARPSTTHFPYDQELSTSTPNNTEAIRLIKESSYVKKNASTTLELTLAIGDSEENRKIAAHIAKDWESIGISTKIEIYEFSDLNQSIIKDRSFQAILVGTYVQKPLDLFAFWHSSQRNYPGLNIAGYASVKMDEALDRLRESRTPEDQKIYYDAVKRELAEENPAIFLYTPLLTYVIQDEVSRNIPSVGQGPSSRFQLVSTWYLLKEKVWAFSYRDQTQRAIEKLLH